MQLKNHHLWGMFRAICLAMTLVSMLTGSSRLYAGTLQQSVTALGLTAIPNDLTAPAFHLPDLEGQMVSLHDYQGQVVMLYFWTTW